MKNTVINNQVTTILSLFVTLLAVILKSTLHIDMTDIIQGAIVAVVGGIYFLIAHQAENKKVVLGTIIASLALILKQYFLVNIDPATQQAITDVIFYGFTMFGIFLKDDATTTTTSLLPS